MTSTPSEKNTNITGAFKRKAASFRNHITADGSSGFPAETDRYHLYIARACPWAHRTMMVRALKGLEKIITVSVVEPFMGNKGWTFNPSLPDCTDDPVFNAKHISEIYFAVDPDYSGRYTVPLLVDKKQKTIVNNESSEIIRMFTTAFDSLEGIPKLDLYPEDLREKIDAVNEWVYPDINNGVYKCGFARSQEAYNAAVTALFSALDKAEEILSKQRYLTGNQFTEADLRLWVTLIRFDPVYQVHFKCSAKKITQYPNMWNFVKEIYQMKGVADTWNLKATRDHYFQSHTSINPFGIVAALPSDFDVASPHDRTKFPAKS